MRPNLTYCLIYGEIFYFYFVKLFLPKIVFNRYLRTLNCVNALLTTHNNLSSAFNDILYLRYKSNNNIYIGTV